MTKKIIYDLNAILELLPHREPFLFVDCITEFRLNKKIKSEKYISSKMPFFKGHFPSEPIMPGVLITDALAQTSGLLWGFSKKETAVASQDNECVIFYLASDHMKYLKPVRPDSTLVMESSFQENFGALFKYKVAAFVKRDIVAKGEITLAIQGINVQ
ncbi:MAG: 3-hydroxyacyl-ACP dehydratase FabZ [Fibrobacter sp.]|nr:3-hydroxyacyl-ACP dehydratase FabZ [Fibrobacter sp.]